MPLPSSLQWDRKFVQIGSLDVTGLDERFLQKTVSFQSERNANYIPFPDLCSFDERQGGYAWKIVVAPHTVIETPSLNDNESYSLVCSKKDSTIVCNIEAPTSTGVLRAKSTLLQLIARHTEKQGKYFLPLVHISDSPAYVWRGLMVDVARNFHPVQDIEKIIDGMEYLKLNTLHLHLVDDQGWRVEIEAYPDLTLKSGEGGFYTKQDISRIISYASERGVRVYPEIDVPGHNGASIFAYNSFSASSTPPPELVKSWGIFRYVLDPSKEEVFTFFEAVVSEISAMFPDEFFHMGGDEVRWPRPSPSLQDWMNMESVSVNQ